MTFTNARGETVEGEQCTYPSCKRYAAAGKFCVTHAAGQVREALADWWNIPNRKEEK